MDRRCYVSVSGTRVASSTPQEKKSWERPAAAAAQPHASIASIASIASSPHRGKEQSPRSSLLHLIDGCRHRWPASLALGFSAGRVGAPPSRPLSALWTCGPVTSSTTDSS
ncbi:uncharacterized protein LOC107401153 isoform X2 [Peromyscus maniculatus bairdii]|uniref:uncharacterized protein LOC107401153 isoform X2 n=1 Tax=Peromyscus maniculatus bairdii TaxID=230844 RepID=UPI003FCFE61D